MATPTSPVRRALAQKSANASLNVNKATKPINKPSLPQTAQLPPRGYSAKPDLISEEEYVSPRLGQKRKAEDIVRHTPGRKRRVSKAVPPLPVKKATISDLEDDVEDDHEVAKSDSQDSDNTELLSDPISNDSLPDTDHGDMMGSPDDTNSTGQTTLPSFHASQEGPGPVDVQFEIPEEMSQRTLDNLVSVKTSANEDGADHRSILCRCRETAS